MVGADGSGLGGGDCGDCGDGGATAQATTLPRIAPLIPRPHQHLHQCPVSRRPNAAMWLIMIEALGAGLILVVIVWWTMFSGRKGGERHDPGDKD